MSNAPSAMSRSSVSGRRQLALLLLELSLLCYIALSAFWAAALIAMLYAGVMLAATESVSVLRTQLDGVAVEQTYARPSARFAAHVSLFVIPLTPLTPTFGAAVSALALAMICAARSAKLRGHTTNYKRGNT